MCALHVYAEMWSYAIARLQLMSSPPCWMTINKRIISSIVPVIQHGCQGLCRFNLTGMVANHLLVGAWHREKQQIKLVEGKLFVDTVRIKSADLKIKFLF